METRQGKSRILRTVEFFRLIGREMEVLQPQEA